MAICEDKLYYNASIKQLENYIWKYDSFNSINIHQKLRNISIRTERTLQWDLEIIN